MEEKHVEPEEIEIIMRKYIRKMWGTRKEAPKKERWIKSKTTEIKMKEIEAIINGKIKIEELNRAINKLKRNKTPGVDLIANEIFMIMPEKLREKLVEDLEECRINSTFPKDWKETEIKWIFKEKGSPTMIKNYRPIALLNTAYKIYTRIMTERLEIVAEKFGMLSDAQQGFRADRSCMAAGLMMKIIMNRRLRKETPLHVAFIDISKAYDTVNHETLWKIMEESGIKGKLIENIKELYKENQIKAITPYGKTKGVEMKRGIRQGCPLSPLLFAMYVEPIEQEMEKLNRNKESEPGILMYADDMIIWAETKEELETKLSKMYETMEQLGLEMSMDKTEIQKNKYETRTEQKGLTLTKPNGGKDTNDI